MFCPKCKIEVEAQGYDEFPDGAIIGAVCDNCGTVIVHTYRPRREVVTR